MQYPQLKRRERRGGYRSIPAIGIVTVVDSYIDCLLGLIIGQKLRNSKAFTKNQGLLYSPYLIKGEE